MHNRLYKCMEKFELLYSLQFGFREKHSTTHAVLLSLTQSIKHSIDNGTFGYGIFLDLQKVFDTANHDILINKLEHYGMRGNDLNWLRSYRRGTQENMA